MNFENSWGNEVRSGSYAKLEFPNTYHLAYRDLPEIIANHVQGSKALDFGCGTGRSARFLKRLNFEVTAVDISPDMLGYAKELDPTGEYLLVSNGSYSHLGVGNFDLILSIFTFDNIQGWENRILILKALTNLLTPSGRMICLDANPELYTHEWASFSTLEFPENRYAKNGDIVRIVMKDVEDTSPVEDILWTESAYHQLFDLAGLTIEATYKPLGVESDPCKWLMESSIAPWFIFVMKRLS
jgi:ubiquinone/menaquinone biosynthesis C-methylase UbiE